jgi:hypothetical protein
MLLIIQIGCVYEYVYVYVFYLRGQLYRLFFIRRFCLYFQVQEGYAAAFPAYPISMKIPLSMCISIIWSRPQGH